MESASPVLTVGGIIANGFKIGIKNAPSLIGAALLWILTIWIPYINVGTTIGMISIVVAMSRGSIISPVEIFDGKYRRYMGEFFLLAGFRGMGVLLGLIFLVIPGIVIAIAWSQAYYLLVDRKLNPTECLKTSNDMTYGHKWTIFGGMFLLALSYQIVSFILFRIAFMSGPVVMALISIILILLFLPVIFGAWAHVYKILCEKAGFSQS